MIILLGFAFLAGLVTALSPCSLPILPILLAAGTATKRVRPVAIVTGLVISFTFFTLFLTAIVQALGISPDILRYIAIAFIFLFGLVLLVPALSDRFARSTTALVDAGEKVRLQSEKWGGGAISGLLLGMGLGLLWTPCAGPILAAIATLAAAQTVSTQLILLTLAYSLGAAVPMLLLIYGGGYVLRSSRLLSPHAEQIRKGFGVVMLLTALAMASGLDARFQEWASNFVPSLVVEDSPTVRRELKKLRKTNPESRRDLTGITAWLNTEPLTLEQLKGKVVMIDFWTYSCINCIRTLPYLKQWYDSYKDKGFVIVGVHTPEFEFEKKKEHVAEAVKRFGITYPVALDSDYKTWNAFQNIYWPADYLFDQQGKIRDVHFGEGEYVETENKIRALLGLSPLEKVEPQSPMRVGQTPETYLGYKRGDQYIPGISIKRDQKAVYAPTASPEINQVALKGSWNVGPESITAEGDDSFLELNFQATHVYLVLGGKSSKPVEVLLDGAPLPQSAYTPDMKDRGQIYVDEPRKYDIVDLKGQFGRHTVTLHIPQGVSAFAFTFGSN